MALSFLLAVAAVPATTAGADSPYDWGYTGGSDPSRAPDSRDHWHCKTYFDIHHDWLNSAVEQLDGQTVMDRYDASSCGTSTDVVWIKSELDGIDGGEYRARSLCATHVSWGVCDQFWTQVDQPWFYVAAFSQGASDPSDWYSRNIQMAMRHEIGHTAGLHHYTGSLSSTYGVMNTVLVPNGTPGWLGYLAYKAFHEQLVDGNM